MCRCCWIKHTRVAWPRLLQRKHPSLLLPSAQLTTLLWPRRSPKWLHAQLSLGIGQTAAALLTSGLAC
jgi:hypothetical protein